MRREAWILFKKAIKTLWGFSSFKIGLIALSIVSAGFVPIGLGMLAYYYFQTDFLTNILIALGLLEIWIGLIVLFLMYLPKMFVEMWNDL